MKRKNEELKKIGRSVISQIVLGWSKQLNETKRILKAAYHEEYEDVEKTIDAVMKLDEYCKDNEIDINKYTKELQLIYLYRQSIEKKLDNIYEYCEGTIKPKIKQIIEYRNLIKPLDITDLVLKYHSTQVTLKENLIWEQLEEKIYKCENKGDLALALLDEDKEIRDLAQHRYNQLEIKQSGLKQFVKR